MAFALPSASVGAMAAEALDGGEGMRWLICAEQRPSLISPRWDCGKASGRRGSAASRRKAEAGASFACISKPNRRDDHTHLTLRSRLGLPGHVSPFSAHALLSLKSPLSSADSDSWPSVSLSRRLPHAMASPAPPATNELRRKVLRVLFFSLLLDLVFSAAPATPAPPAFSRPKLTKLLARYPSPSSFRCFRSSSSSTATTKPPMPPPTPSSTACSPV